MEEFELSPKQQTFFTCKADVIFYGGARAGAKTYSSVSYAMFMCASRENYKALIVRSNWNAVGELESVIKELRKHFGGKLKSGTQNPCVTWDNGSVLYLRALSGPEDEEKIRGFSCELVIVDEAVLISPDLVIKLQAIVRSNKYPTSFRMTGNPGAGPALKYIKDTFVLPTKLLEPKKPEYWEWEKDGLTYAFIQAGPRDNPFIDYEKYVASIKAMGESIYQAWILNNWDTVESEFLPHITSCIKDVGVDEENDVICVGLDPGFVTSFAVCMAIDYEGNYKVFKTLKNHNKTTSEIAEILHQNLPRIDYLIVDPNDFDKASATAGATTNKTLLLDAGLNPIPGPLKSRVEGWRVLRNYMADGTLSIDPDCYDLVDSLESLTPNPLKVEDCKKGENDHGADALRAVVTYAHIKGTAPLTPQQKHIKEYNEIWDKILQEEFSLDRYNNRW